MSDSRHPLEGPNLPQDQSEKEETRVEAFERLKRLGEEAERLLVELGKKVTHE